MSIVGKFLSSHSIESVYLVRPEKQNGMGGAVRAGWDKRFAFSLATGSLRESTVG